MVVLIRISCAIDGASLSSGEISCGWRIFLRFDTESSFVNLVPSNIVSMSQDNSIEENRAWECFAS